MHVTEDLHKDLDLSARAPVIQRDLLVERVTVDRITPAPPPVDEPATQKKAAKPAYLPVKNLDGEAWLVDGLRRH